MLRELRTDELGFFCVQDKKRETRLFLAVEKSAVRESDIGMSGLCPGTGRIQDRGMSKLRFFADHYVSNYVIQALFDRNYEVFKKFRLSAV